MDAAQIALTDVAKIADISIKNIDMVIATGAFREQISFASYKKSEFLCLARGIEHLLPSTRTLLDLGARKSLAVKCFAGKAIKVNTSNKCASGNGAYLEILKDILKINNNDLDDLFFQSANNIEIHSNCAVFAESEIISLLHSGVKPEDIVRGVFKGLAGRLYSQLLELGVEKEIAIVGGVAKSKAIVVALEEILKLKVSVPENPEIVGALGASLIGQEIKE